MKLPLFLMVFVNVSIHFWIWTWIRIRNPRVTDPAKVPDPCGSGSTTLLCTTQYLPRRQRHIGGQAKAARLIRRSC
jgi:hypothetical protein